MRIGQRLFLAVIPAIIGVFTVAALAYWEEYVRQAPRTLVIVAIVAAVISIGMAWYNTRYVARRVERLVTRTTGQVASDRHIPLRDLASAVTGGVVAASGGPDELDAIESTVSNLNRAVQRARDEGELRARNAEAREAEYVTLVGEVMRVVASRLEEAELPLHVLLSSPFGSLNENQEEMLTAAQSAVGGADIEVRRLMTLLALDQGGTTAVRRPIGLRELLKPTLPMVEARGHKAQVTVHAEISETLPRIIVDATQVQAALSTLLTMTVEQTPPGGDVDITAHEADSGHVRLTSRYGGTHGGTRDLTAVSRLDLQLVRRLVLLQQGELQTAPGQVTIVLPSEAPVAVGREGGRSGV